jgi:hypothetical protein
MGPHLRALHGCRFTQPEGYVKVFAMMRLALALLFCLSSLLGFLVLTQNLHGGLTLSAGTWQLQLPLGASVVYAVITILGCIYLGQLLNWAGGLAARLRGESAKQGLGLLTAAWSAYLVGDYAGANKLTAQAWPKLTATETPLADLLKSQTTEEDIALTPHTSHPTIGAAVCLRLALLAAQHKNWEDVKTHTTQGLALHPDSPYILMLHLKALLNTNDVAGAHALLPTLKPLVSPTTWSLLQLAVKGPAGHGAAGAGNLNHPWLKTFKSWLATTSTKLPEA